MSVQRLTRVPATGCVRPAVLAAVTCACSPAPQPRADVPISDSAKASATAEVVSAEPPASASSPPPKPLSTVVAVRDPLPEALELLEPLVVDASHIGRRVLLSWTTHAQADAITKGGAVLSLEESKAWGPSGFDWMLDDEVGRGNALARLIFQRGFAKKRFAWPSAYATAGGAGGGRYGSVLLAIELKDDALLVDFSTQKVFDINNREVAMNDLVARPERLAAVYWQTTGFREYVLVNESQMAKVSFGTADALALFEAEKTTLASLDRAMRRMLMGDETALLEKFAKTLAFQTNAARTDVERVIDEAKTSPPEKLAFSTVPTAKLTLGGPRARLRRPGCKLTGAATKPWRDRSYGGGKYCIPADRCQYVAGNCDVIRRSLSWLDASGG